MAAPKGNKYAEGNDGGRPTKYKPEYCEQLIEHMTEGLSYESFGANCNVCRDTLYEWEKQHKEFSDARKVGRSHLLAFFERVGRSAMAGKIKNFSAAAFIFNAKNKIGWTDKQENINTNENINITIDKSDKKL